MKGRGTSVDGHLPVALRVHAKTSPALSPRQWEILRLRALGGTDESIGLSLGIRRQTVKNHLTVAYRKLSARCLADALRAVGWLQVP